MTEIILTLPRLSRPGVVFVSEPGAVVSLRLIELTSKDFSCERTGRADTTEMAANRRAAEVGRILVTTDLCRRRFALQIYCVSLAGHPLLGVEDNVGRREVRSVLSECTVVA